MNMCIIVYKPSGIKLPNKEVLKTCFDNNKDGAGFMYAHKGQVHIKKGFMDFSSFEENLTKTLKYVDEVKTPMVLHFRITTQGGVNQPCTHPFPLSKDMSDLRQLQCTTNIGIAHNGIISLTSESGYYYGYDSYKSKKIDYSDTMKFITDYLSLIIKTPKYYKDADTLELIERLVDSKLAILDLNGHCELIGNFVKDNGIYYSNESYKPRVYKTITTKPQTKATNNFYSTRSLFDNAYEMCFDDIEGEYDFSLLGQCPIDEGDADYCGWCSKCNNCNKTIPNSIGDFHFNGILLHPSKEFYRINGNLMGISYDDDENMYEVCYDEYDGETIPYDAELIMENEAKD
jgi:predicted glutamine amidotransferase